MAFSHVVPELPDAFVESYVNSDSDHQELLNEAVWYLSGAKAGHGVQNLSDDNLNTYWQSDGGEQPHTITLRFNTRTSLSLIAFYTDHSFDESYTPKDVSILSGSSVHDLTEVRAVSLHEPSGWVHIPLGVSNTMGQNRYLRTFILRITVKSMHQAGRDTRIRQLKVFGPKSDVIATATSTYLPPFRTPEMLQYSTIR